MKVKILQSNNLSGLEREINKFLKEIKIENLQLAIDNNNYIAVITYYSLE